MGISGLDVPLACFVNPEKEETSVSGVGDAG